MERNILKQEALDNLIEHMKKHLGPHRFQHSMRVSATAISLAMCYGGNMEQAQIAGILHDCAKCMKEDKLLKIAKDAQISVSDIQKENPSLLHATIGSYLAATKYEIEDQDILQAIANHTLGRPNMSLLEKIIYVADYIEPERDRAPNLAELRQLSYRNLDKAIYRIATDTVAYVIEQGKPIDPAAYETIKAYHSV